MRRFPGKHNGSSLRIIRNTLIPAHTRLTIPPSGRTPSNVRTVGDSASPGSNCPASLHTQSVNAR